MNRKKRIQKILTNYFKESKIEVLDNSIGHSGHNEFDGSQESHFKILIDNDSVKLISRIDLHRKINQLLKDEFNNGLHALQIIKV